MSNYRFRLEHYRTGRKYRCPGCGGRRRFSRYIDTLTGEHVHDTVGCCDRRDKCGYHYPPREYFKDNGIKQFNTPLEPKSVPDTPLGPPSYIDFALFEKSLSCYEQNNFVQFLIKLFGEEKAQAAVERYYIGTSKKWVGAVVFWQVDVSQRIRAGKIMLYNAATGNRAKGTKKYISWVHSVCRLENGEFNLRQCFFGEHLLSVDVSKKVAIVESEKTAVVASLLIPEFIWLAAGSKEGLSEEKAKALKGRNVILFPDAGCWDHWTRKAKALSHICNIGVHGVLETNVSEAEKKEGYDIADYLIKQQEAERSCSCSN